MKRIISLLLSVLLIISISLPLYSCGGKAPELESVKERLVYLIEESKEMNVLFFGSGLPVYRRDSEISERKMIYFDDSQNNYDRVYENSEFFSIDEIKARAEKVYSKDYVSEIYEGAIEGIMTGNTSAYVKFYDDGKNLLQNTNATDFKLSERIYDYSTMEIIKPSNATNINVALESYSLADSTRHNVRLSFTYENGNWYLDSPSY